jgi:hypothetical protein
MRHNRYVCLIFCSIALIWGCQPHTCRIEDTATETTSSFVQQPKAILVPLPDPIFIAASGSDSNGVINLTISDTDSFGFGTSGRMPYKMLTFCFVDSDCENKIPPRIYVGCESPNDIGARMLTARESAAVVEVLEQYLESHYNQDQLRSLSKDPDLPINSRMRAEPPYCLMHIIHQHKSYNLKAKNGIERTR